ncbi:MAG: RNA polymerase factor sigma-54 [Pseudomonadota bacterium]
MKQTLEQSLSLQLKLSPRLQQAIQLLPLATLELRLTMLNKAEENPFLEMEDDDLPHWPYFSQSNATNATHINQHHPQFETEPPERESLKAYLQWQLAVSHLTAEEHPIADMLIDALDDDGYLRTPLADIFPDTDNLVPHGAVLKKVQQFDPPGIAAQNVQHCLLLQAQALYPHLPDYNLICTLIQHHLDSLHLPAHTLAQRLNRTEASLSASLSAIQALQPRPGNLYASKHTDFLIPDAVVEKTQHGWSITLNQDLLPKLRIHPYAHASLRAATTKQAQQVLKSHLREAEWFLSCLQRRQETLQAVLRYIITQQSDFLTKKSPTLNPLSIQTIATALQVHPSTISRTVRNKLIEMPSGIISLKSLLCSSLSLPNGQAISSDAIKHLMQQFIDTEPQNHPLSDEKLAELLGKIGIQISRRTVTKYREALNIHSCHKRRKPAI